MATDVEKLYPHGSMLTPCVYPHKTKDDRRKLNDELNYWVEEIEQSKWTLCLRYFTNVAFLMGNQYATFLWNTNDSVLSYSNLTGNVSVPGGPESAIPRTVNNQLIRPYESMISLLTEIQPKPRVTPRSSAPEDADSAAIAEIIHDLKWESMNMQRKLRQVGSTLALTGTAIGEIEWRETTERTKKPVYGNITETNLLEGEEIETQAVVGEEDGFREDVHCTIWTPFQFAADPGATEDPDSHTWFYRHQYVDVGWVREEFDRDEEGYYPEQLDTIREEDGLQYPVYWYERIKDIIESPEGWIQFSTRINQSGTGFAPNQTLLRIWDCRPNKHYPRGRTMVQAGDKLIYCGDARAVSESAPDRWHPYAIARFWTVMGRFWGIPLLSQLLPLQKKINAIDSLKRLHRELSCIGQWMVPKQANIQDGELTGVPGATLHYVANSVGAKPERIETPPLPSDFWAESDEAKREIERIAGTESFLTTEAPSAVRAGTMLDLLTRKERQSRSPTLQDFSDFLGTIGRNVLIEAADHLRENDPEFTEQIALAARDRASQIAVITFQGADLRNNFNVSYDIASELLKSPEAKQQKAMEAGQYFGRDLSRADKTKLMSIAGLDEFVLEETSDYKRARRMISVITSGEIEGMAELPGIDDPEIFMGLLKEEIQSDRMVTYTEEVQKVLFAFYATYAQLHAQAIQAQMEQQIQMQALAKQASSGSRQEPGSPP